MMNSHLEEALGDLLADSISLITPTELQLVKRLQSFQQQRCYKTYTRDELSYLEYLVKGRDRQPQVADAIGQLERAMQQKLEEAVQKEKFNDWPKQPVNKEHIEAIMKERKVRQIKYQKDLLQKQLYRINRSIEEAQFQHQLQEKAEEQKQKNINEALGAKTVRDVSAAREEQAMRKKQVQKLIQQINRQKLERKKKIEESLAMLTEKHNQKKEEELKQEREMLEARRREIMERKKRMEEQREKERTGRSQHELTYVNKISRVFSVEEQMRLMENERRQQQEQLRKKLMTRKEKMNLQPLDTAKLEQHSRRYEEYRQKEEQKRQERLKLQQEQAQHDLVKHYSSYEKYRGLNEGNLSSDDCKQPVRMKVQRMRDYQALVRDKYKPKVDASKRRELQNQIEELELGGRHIRRSRLENGSVLLQEIHRSDPKIIGLQYLEQMKKLVEKSRSQRRPEESNASQEVVRKTDYLAELRQKNRRKIDFSSELNRFQTYDQKVQAVQHRTNLLLEQAKRKEKLLKHGKFLSPSQILQYKQELDDQYLDIINLKLKLIQ